jgi:hypothetical protein
VALVAQNSFSFIFANLLVYSVFLARAFATPAEYIEEPHPKKWGVQLFLQNLNSSLNIEDKSRKVEISPEPPGFNGIGLSYSGIGFSFQSANDDVPTRSSASAFKWTIPWRNHFIEFYRGRYSGAKVSDGIFRADIESNVLGLHITRARDTDFDFSSVYGLEEHVTSAKKKKTSTTFWSGSIQEILWTADSAFISNPIGPDDELAFKSVRRNLATLNYGKAYVKYWEYFRFGSMGGIGGFYGKRKLKYSSRNELNQDEYGVGVNLALSGASDYGFKRFNKYYDLSTSYGLAVLVHTTTSFTNPNAGTTQSAGIIYIGTLF